MDTLKAMNVLNGHETSHSEDLLTAEQAAALLPGANRAQLMRWARDGLVPSVQYVPRGQRLFRRSDIEALLEPVVGDRVPDSSAEDAALLPGLGRAGR